MVAELALEMISPVIQKFDDIFESKVVVDRQHYQSEKDSFFRTYRALKETFRSAELNRIDLTNSEFRTLADYLLDNDKFGSMFQEWIGKRGLEWEMKTWPRNAHRLYALGKQGMLRRTGKK